MCNLYISSSCIKTDNITTAVETLVEKGVSNIELSGGTNYIKDIKEKLGIPPVCLFRDEFCGNVTFNDDNPFPIQIGHIKPSSKGGSIKDIDNLIWICNRHNMMMNDRTMEEFNGMINSMIKKL